MHIKDVAVTFLSIHDQYYVNEESYLLKKVHYAFSIVQGPKGRYDVKTDDNDYYSVPSNEIFITAPRHRQYIKHHFGNKEIHAKYFFCNIEINDGYNVNLFYDFPVIPPQETAERIKILLDKIVNTDNICERKGYSYFIGKELMSLAVERKDPCPDVLLRVTDYIKKHYSQKITVSDLAKYAFVSEASLYGTFNKHLRTSPISYLNDHRLNIASKLLITTDNSIEEIAYSVGIADSRYFSKMFKSKFKMSPTQYRNRAKTNTFSTRN